VARSVSEAGTVAQRVGEGQTVTRQPESNSAGRVTLLSPELARHDGVGWLVAIPGARVGEPSYALLDDAGSLVSYVIAAPGVRLGSHLGKRVAIDGNRQPIPQTDASSLTARRITTLDSRRRF
jgi:hypothetical protein